MNLYCILIETMKHYMIISSEVLNYIFQEIILNFKFLSIELPDSYDVVFGCQGLLKQLYYICRLRIII